MRRAFTLIELVMAVLILSILLIFLYKSYADLNRSNRVYTEAAKQLDTKARLKKSIYLDLLLASKESILHEQEDQKFDFISFMTEHSLHRRIKPYVSYVVKEHILYRLESREQIKSQDIGTDIAFDIDKIGNVEKLKFFPEKKDKRAFYLLDLRLKGEEQVLLKIKVLN